MRRTLAIVLVAAVVGGLAGASIGLAFDNKSSTTGASALTSAVSSGRTVKGLTPEAIYNGDSPGVVVITDTVTQVVPPTVFTPGGKQQVGALGSGFVIETIVGTDPSTDIAVERAKAPASALHPLALANSRPGDTLELEVVRGGTSRTVTVTLGNAPA
jgi:S1-C subfamily serine protease